MTGQQLKDIIDLHITNVITKKDITNINVGSDMKETVNYINQEITTVNNAKVDKVAGKELSKNDFTDILKAKLDSITAIFTTALKTAYDNTVNVLTDLLATGSRLITTDEITKLSNTSGTNTGDQDLSGLQQTLTAGANISIVGNVISFSAQAKVYKAKLTQNGNSNITASVLKNDTGKTFTYTRSSVGSYSLNFSSLFSDLSKVDIYIHLQTTSYGSPQVVIDNFGVLAVIETKYWTGADFILSDGILNNSTIYLVVND